MGGRRETKGKVAGCRGAAVTFRPPPKAPKEDVPSPAAPAPAAPPGAADWAPVLETLERLCTAVEQLGPSGLEFGRLLGAALKSGHEWAAPAAERAAAQKALEDAQDRVIAAEDAVDARKAALLEAEGDLDVANAALRKAEEALAALPAAEPLPEVGSLDPRLWEVEDAKPLLSSLNAIQAKLLLEPYHPFASPFASCQARGSMDADVPHSLSPSGGGGVGPASEPFAVPGDGSSAQALPPDAGHAAPSGDAPPGSPAKKARPTEAPNLSAVTPLPSPGAP